MVSIVPPGLIVWILVVLIDSQLMFALLPARPRTYLTVLALTAAGFVIGQVWTVIGLPSLQFGEAGILPSALFALLLQPLAPYVPIRLRKG